jgi:hypothetical protein
MQDPAARGLVEVAAPDGTPAGARETEGGTRRAPRRGPILEIVRQITEGVFFISSIIFFFC